MQLKGSYPSLKDRHRKERHAWPINLSLRVHRSLSWLNRAEQCEGDPDAAFIFLWIAFNAAYAQDLSYKQFSERGTFRQFFKKLSDLDKDRRLNQLVWTEFSGSIRMLLNNQYIFQPFWDYHNKLIGEQQWKDDFASAKKRAARALSGQNTADLLVIVFSRLYTLRNQLVHGGATWQGSANREQLRDGVSFLGKLVPLLIEMMMDNPQTLWGDANYPVVD